MTTSTASRMRSSSALYLLGHPVAQVKLPQLLKKQTGSSIMVPIDVHPGEFDACLKSLKSAPDTKGIVITVPHKVNALHHVEVLSDSAQAAGSINVMRPLGDGRWEGDNFDGKGFAAGLAAKGVDLRGRSAYLCGLGGAGSAIAGELLYAGVRRLEIEEINAERAQERISLLPPTFQGRVKIVGPADPIHAEVAINATPLGMKNRGILPFSISRLRNPDTIVCDIIMDPAQTQLLLQAQALGFRTHRGIHMLEKQLQLIVSYFSLDQLPSPALSSTLAAG